MKENMPFFDELDCLRNELAGKAMPVILHSFKDILLKAAMNTSPDIGTVDFENVPQKEQAAIVKALQSKEWQSKLQAVYDAISMCSFGVADSMKAEALKYKRKQPLKAVK